MIGQAVGEELLAGGRDSSIAAGHVVTDGVGPGTLYKGIKSAMEEEEMDDWCQNQDCSKHLSSTLRRNMRKINLTSLYLDDNAALRKKKCDRLLDYISKRCNWEFRALWKVHKDDIQTLIMKCSEAEIGIISCIYGQGLECKKRCAACYIHRKGQPDRIPRALPDSKFVSGLSNLEMGEILRVMDKKLGECAVKSQRYNLTTNNCEASHRTTQRSLPKNKTFKRSFKSRAHSAVHSMSLGHIRSTVCLNKKLGVANNIHCKAFTTLRGLHRRYEYQQKRRRTIKHKKARMKARIRALRNRAVADDFGHVVPGQNPAVQFEHNYNTR